MALPQLVTRTASASAPFHLGGETSGLSRRDGMRRWDISLLDRGTSAPDHRMFNEGTNMPAGWLRRPKSSGVALAFAMGLLTAGLFQLPYQSTAQQQATPGTPAAAGKLPAGSAGLYDLSEAFASVAEHIKPSVVYIRSGRKPDTARQNGPQSRPRMQVPPGFEEFFRNMPPMQQPPRF